MAAATAMEAHYRRELDRQSALHDILLRAIERIAEDRSWKPLETARDALTEYDTTTARHAAEDRASEAAETEAEQVAA